jgi:hypothetical protein
MTPGAFTLTVERQDGRRYAVRGALPLHRAEAWARDLRRDPGVRRVVVCGPGVECPGFTEKLVPQETGS